MTDKKKYKEGIDFIIPAYDIRTFDYIKVCVASIQKFWKDYPYTIHIVVNYETEEEVEKYRKYFKETYPTELQDILPVSKIKDKKGTYQYIDCQNPHDVINIISGVDQSSTTIVNDRGQVTQMSGTNAPGYPKGIHEGKIDGHSVAAGSWYGAWAFNKALKECDREYVCALHEDSIFLSSYVTKLLQIIDNGYYKFISNRWCPGSVFPKCIGNEHKFSKNIGINYGDDESGMARCMMFLCKREFYDQIEAEDYVKKGIWTSSPWSCDYRDMTGNITWYCREKKYPFLILENSFEDSHRVANYKKRHHIINITEGLHDTEQAWCDGIPIWFHHGRGGYRPSGSLDEWITQTTNYLKSNKGTFDAENGQYIW